MAFKSRFASDKSLGIMILWSYTLSLVAAVFRWLDEVASFFVGSIVGILVAVITLYCGIKARAGLKKTKWFLVPPLLFTVVPMAAQIYLTFFTNKQTGIWQKIWEITPFFLGFVLPFSLLLFVYYQLSRR